MWLVKFSTFAPLPACVLRSPEKYLILLLSLTPKRLVGTPSLAHMKLPRYAKLTAFLWISLLAFATYAWMADPFQITDEIALNQWGLKDFFGAKPQKVELDTVAVQDTTPVAPVEPPRPPVDSSEQSILLAGDSMAECLLYGIRSYAKSSGHKVHCTSWYGSSTVKWAKSDTLETAIRRHKPTLVIFCLGANELTIPNIWNREKYLQAIVKKLEGTKYLWVSPPNWTEDTGLTEMIEKNVPTDQLFISKDLKLDRRRDGAHPTVEASKIWMDSVAHWIVNKSAYPIVLNKAELKADSISPRDAKMNMGMSSASATENKAAKSARAKA